tara:strand:- start:544 stop:2139 length:1596 start_codon:yes stop_codon:yes gene_type:complete
MNSTQIMRVAQSLYENGHITYMRTDSIHLSKEALNASRSVIEKKYGSEYLPKSPRIYKGKTKNVQEAHEAIRPAGSKFKDPSELKSSLTEIEYKVYELIWKRTVASQMNSAKTEQTKLEITSDKYVFVANGKTIIFPGFLRAYVEGADDPNEKLDDMENTLPIVKKGEKISWDDIIPKQHFTKPIARFTEASLVKELEALGIGRPSTYATIMRRIQDKGYVNNAKGSLIPTFTGYAIVQFLEKNFKDLVNLQYTSKMEDDLDTIALGGMTKENYLNNFYYSKNGNIGLSDKLEKEYDRTIERLILTIKNQDKTSNIKIGRFGIYAEIGDDKVTIDNDTIPSELNIKDIEQMLVNKNSEPEVLSKDKESGENIELKKGRFGPYLKCGKKMKSLPPGVTEDTLTSDIAEQVIAMPAEIGIHPENNKPIIKDIGRYGPYLKNDGKNKKVSLPDDILNITVERAVEIFASSGNQNSVLRELGKHDDKEIIIKDGRYGIYITNGKINVTIPKDIDYTSLELSQAIDMINKKKAKKK